MEQNLPALCLFLKNVLLHEGFEGLEFIPQQGESSRRILIFEEFCLLGFNAMQSMVRHTKRHYIPEDKNLHNHCWDKNLKTYMILIFDFCMSTIRLKGSVNPVSQHTGSCFCHIISPIIVSW
jgi:hypothetical protein